MVAAPLRVDERQLDPAVALSALDEGVPREPHRQFALKHEDCFVVADGYGDIRGAGDGLFRNDTRVLSLMRLYVGGQQPALLGASLSQDNILFTANLSNRGSATTGVPNGVIHIQRTRLLWQDRMYERIALTNYWGRKVVIPLKLEFSVDFRDMFEVRGTTRSKRGLSRDAEVGERNVAYRYEGLDQVARQSIISFSVEPAALAATAAEFVIEIPQRGRECIFIEVGEEHMPPSRERFRAATARGRWAMRSKRRHGGTITSSGRVFNDWLTRARADIALLTTDLETGPYPYAGIPWFSTEIGRAHV